MPRIPNPASEHYQPQIKDLPLFGGYPVRPGGHDAPPDAGGPLYPDYIAGTDTNPTGHPWELGLQRMLPPGPVGPGPGLRSVDDDGHDYEVPDGQAGFDIICPGWAVVGECEGHHVVAREVLCNREWCPGCGKEDGQAHQRRKAAWLPKARQISSMGRFVLTIPPELRAQYRTKDELGKVGTAAKRMMQRHGFARGLRRWHWFGELDTALERGLDRPAYHPHMEILVDGGWLRPELMERVKQSWANILHVDRARVNVYYEFIQPHDTRRKLHRLAYALRPTFLVRSWDVELAEELHGFRGRSTWGQWDGPPVWDVPADPEAAAPSRELEALVAGQCPKCGKPVKWLGIIDVRSWEGQAPDGWRGLDGGYYAGFT